MQLERIEISKLSNDPANARKHPERNLEAIVASLRRFGQQKPIVIDKSNVVRAGNGTIEAAKQLGWTHIDCVRTSLESSDAIAYAIADNRTSELAEWDDDVLAAQLNGLLADDEELLLAAGFDEDELAEILGDLDDEEPGEIVEDEVPEPPADPITKPGDLWILGRHRLLCGDSTKAEDVARLMAGAKADCVFTDPPYGVDYSDKNTYLNEADKGNRNQLAIENDNLSESQLSQFLQSSFGHAFEICRPGSAWYVASPPGPLFCAFGNVLAKLGIWRQTLTWVKSNFVLGRSDYKYQHEPFFYGWKPGEAHRWYGGYCETTAIEDIKPKDVGKMKKEELVIYVKELIAKAAATETSVIREPKPASSVDHPTTKPVKLLARFIRNSSKLDDIGYDPFLGSGTTLIAAEQLGRKCYGMEISPQYCDVIVKRWENLTGEKAVCQSATLD
jgi:DNA modification methylase